MFTLEINNISIPLPEGITLPVVLRSPLFDIDNGKTPGSFIFDTDLAATPELQRAVGFLHKLNKEGTPTGKFTYKLRQGILRYEGSCNVTQCTKDFYQVSFNIATGNLAAALVEKTLKDLDLGGDIEIADNYSSAKRITAAYYGYADLNPFAPMEFFIPFDLQLVDLRSNFRFTNGEVTSFVANKNGNVNLKIAITHRVYYANFSAFRIYINNVVAHQFTLFGTNTEDTINEIVQLGLFTNDVVKFCFYAEQEWQDDYQWAVDLAISDNSYIEFYTDTIFDTVCLGSQDNSLYAIFPVENALFMDKFPDDDFKLDNMSLKTLYTEHFKVLNYYLDGRFPLIISGQVEDVYLSATNLFTPFLYIYHLLKKIASESGYQLLDGPYNAGLFKNAVLFNAVAENIYAEGDTSVLPTKSSFNLSYHVPAISQSDFLRWAAASAGCRLVVNDLSKTIEFVYLVSAMKQPPIAFPGIVLNSTTNYITRQSNGIIFEILKPSSDAYITARIKDIDPKFHYIGTCPGLSSIYQIPNPKVNDYVLVIDNGELYVWMYSPTSYRLAWVFYSKDFFFKRIENKEPFLSRSLDIAPLLSHKTLDETPGVNRFRKWLVPSTWTPGIFEGFPETLSSEYGLQMTFYMGMQSDSLGALYPCASPSKEVYNDSISSAVSLCVTNTLGTDIYTLYYKKWMEWLAYGAKPITYNAILTSYQLHALKLHKPYFINGTACLIKEIRVNILIDGLSQCEIDTYSLI